jgi:hypothetical protein
MIIMAFRQYRRWRIIADQRLGELLAPRRVPACRSTPSADRLAGTGGPAPRIIPARGAGRRPSWRHAQGTHRARTFVSSSGTASHAKPARDEAPP